VLIFKAQKNLGLNGWHDCQSNQGSQGTQRTRAVDTQYILRQRLRQKKNAHVGCVSRIWGIQAGCRTKTVRRVSSPIPSPKPFLGIQPHSSGCSTMTKATPKLAPVRLAIQHHQRGICIKKSNLIEKLAQLLLWINQA